MERAEARTYLRLARALPLAALMFGVGLMLGALGVPSLGVPLLALGLIGWVAAVLSAAAVAARHRGERPWFGPRSVSEDTNELLGWGRLEEATVATGRSGSGIRGQMRAMTAATVLSLLVSAVIVVVRSS